MRSLRTGTLLIVSTLVLACAKGGGPVEEGAPDAPRAPARTVSGAHILPMQHDGVTTRFRQQSGGNPHLVYQGGPVISNAKIVTVFWGASVPDQAKLNAFYTAIVDSPYMDWLSEYNTPKQKIGRGSLVASYVDTGVSGADVSDTDIATELGKLVDQGKIPKNDSDTLYMVYFPPGLTIYLGSEASCSTFCAFHSSASHGGKNLYFGVMPHLGGACAGGCGGDSEFQNLCSASSHEMVEAITDADVGANDIAWYDDSYGEIGDICNAEHATVAGFTVQKQWSNKNGACIATDPNVPPPPSGTGGSGGSAGGAPGTGGSATTGAGGDPGVGAGGSAVGTGGAGTGGDPGAGAGGDPGAGAGGDPGTGGDPGAGGSGTPCDPGGNPGTVCAHDLCQNGGALDPNCDPCAQTICAADAFCCQKSWDDTCRAEVGWYCSPGCF